VVGGDFKKVVGAEGGTEVNDLYFITTINGQDFELEIIKPNDNRYGVLSSLFRGNDLHILINTQDEAAQVNDENELENGKNIIFYGVPGVGKSYTLQNEFKLNERNEAQIKRVVFHADYTHSDFVGQILPILNDENKLENKFINFATSVVLVGGNIGVILTPVVLTKIPEALHLEKYTTPFFITTTLMLISTLVSYAILRNKK